MFEDKRFKKTVRKSFRAARQDMDAFKKSVTDWILYLDSNNREMQARIDQLEREVRDLKRERLHIYS